MVYIPTIRTFQDDLEENRTEASWPREEGIEPIYPEAQTLKPPEQASKSTKIILISISVLFLIASVLVVGYYFYQQRQIATQNQLLNQQARENLELERQRAGVVENIKSVLPLLMEKTKIGDYISALIFKDKVITIEISKNISGESNYSLFYSLILANEKYLKQDLITSFGLKDSPETEVLSEEVPVAKETISPSENLLPTTTEVAGVKPNRLKSLNEIIFVEKTTNNQDYKIADTGKGALVYGYLSDKYFIAATTIRDFMEAVKNLKP